MNQENIRINNAALSCIVDNLKDIENNIDYVNNNTGKSEKSEQKIVEALKQSRSLMALVNAELIIALTDENVLDSVDASIGVRNVPNKARKSDNRRVKGLVNIVDEVDEILLLLETSVDETISSKATVNLVNEEYDIISESLTNCMESINEIYQYSCSI